MLSASYSQRGMSVLLQAKRSNDMAFKSNRNSIGVSSYINHLPAFTQDQTYALAAFIRMQLVQTENGHIKHS